MRLSAAIPPLFKTSLAIAGMVALGCSAVPKPSQPSPTPPGERVPDTAEDGEWSEAAWLTRERGNAFRGRLESMYGAAPFPEAGRGDPCGEQPGLYGEDHAIELRDAQANRHSRQHILYEEELDEGEDEEVVVLQLVVARPGCTRACFGTARRGEALHVTMHLRILGTEGFGCPYPGAIADYARLETHAFYGRYPSRDLMPSRIVLEPFGHEPRILEFEALRR